MKIDVIDTKILSIVMHDAKMPLHAIAKKTGVSAVTILKRMKALEKEGILGKAQYNINYDLLGLDTFVAIQVKISKGKLFELEKKIASSPHVCSVYDMTGNFDALVLARFKTTRQLDKFLKMVQSYDFVESTNTSMILNTIKEGTIALSDL